MIINESKRWLVITPPKTGSHTLHSLLCSPAFGGTIHHADAWRHNTIPPGWADGFRRYLAVRDPFARASSLYRYQLHGFAACWEGPKIDGFEDFARRVLIDHEAHAFYWRSLEDWCGGDAEPIRLEHLADDLATLDPSDPFAVPVENAGREHWSEAYRREPDAWPLVARWAGDDCARFGYDGSPD